MITKIEHIGIAVKDPKKSNEIFEKLLGHASYKSELVESQGVKTYFYQVGESKIELLEATSDKSPINKHLQKRREGMHHLALHVDNIHLELERLTNLGFETLALSDPSPSRSHSPALFRSPSPAPRADVSAAGLMTVTIGRDPEYQCRLGQATPWATLG